MSNRPRKRAHPRPWETTPPGLQGDYTGACVVCLRPTDTGVCFVGDAEWLIAGTIAMGVPEDQAAATVASAMEWTLPNVAAGTHVLHTRLCVECAAIASGDVLTPTLMLSELPVPTYVQPGTDRAAFGLAPDDDE